MAKERDNRQRQHEELEKEEEALSVQVTKLESQWLGYRLSDWSELFTSSLTFNAKKREGNGERSKRAEFEARGGSFAIISARSTLEEKYENSWGLWTVYVWSAATEWFRFVKFINWWTGSSFLFYPGHVRESLFPLLFIISTTSICEPSSSVSSLDIRWIRRIRCDKFVKYGTPVSFGFEVEEDDLDKTRQLVNCCFWCSSF